MAMVDFDSSVTVQDLARFREWSGLPIVTKGVMRGDDAAACVDAGVAGADGVVFGVPEYNYSIPGGLKNALDWVSRPPQHSPMRGKPIGVPGVSS